MGMVFAFAQVALGIVFLVQRGFWHTRTIWVPVVFIALGFQTLTANQPQWHIVHTIMQIVVLICAVVAIAFALKPEVYRDKKRLALQITGLLLVLGGGAVASLAPQQDARAAFMWIGGISVLAGGILWLFARERSPRPDLP